VRGACFLFVILFFGTACTRLPESYAPPVQRPALTVPPAHGLGYFLSMDDPNADLYLVRDFQDHGPGNWRWAYAHPVLRFFVPDAPRLKFTMDFTIPPQTFRDTGPVTLTIRINSRVFDRHTSDRPGEQHYSQDVPGALLHGNAVNEVAIDPDPVWISKADGGRLGFILSRAGFTE
jgi:hypothetical protein